jgi:hypothetical protein
VRTIAPKRRYICVGIWSWPFCAVCPGAIGILAR